MNSAPLPPTADFFALPILMPPPAHDATYASSALKV